MATNPPKNNPPIRGSGGWKDHRTVCRFRSEGNLKLAPEQPLAAGGGVETSSIGVVPQTGVTPTTSTSVVDSTWITEVPSPVNTQLGVRTSKVVVPTKGECVESLTDVVGCWRRSRAEARIDPLPTAIQLVVVIHVHTTTELKADGVDVILANKI